MNNWQFQWEGQLIEIQWVDEPGLFYFWVTSSAQLRVNGVLVDAKKKTAPWPGSIVLTPPPLAAQIQDSYGKSHLLRVEFGARIFSRKSCRVLIDGVEVFAGSDDTDASAQYPPRASEEQSGATWVAADDYDSRNMIGGDQGCNDRAIVMAKKALEVAEQAVGPNHPDVAMKLSSLAILYAEQGQYAQAEPLYKRSLAIREKALGPDHPEVATNLENLAALYGVTNRMQEAAALEDRAAAIRAIKR